MTLVDSSCGHVLDDCVISRQVVRRTKEQAESLRDVVRTLFRAKLYLVVESGGDVLVIVVTADAVIAAAAIAEVRIVSDRRFPRSACGRRRDMPLRNGRRQGGPLDTRGTWLVYLRAKS